MAGRPNREREHPGLLSIASPSVSTKYALNTETGPSTALVSGDTEMLVRYRLTGGGRELEAECQQVAAPEIRHWGVISARKYVQHSYAWPLLLVLEAQNLWDGAQVALSCDG